MPNREVNTPNAGLYYRLRAKIIGVKRILGKPANFAWLSYYRLFRSGRTFRFQGRTYPYFYRFYHATWINERAVEVPLVWSFVDESRSKGARILEVGNVLAHYFRITHDVVDKYEKANGVVNEDMVDFHPAKQYDLIVSISTIEHVGWDEEPKDPNKIARAIENLIGLLSPHGRLIVTAPLGYNPEFDRLIREKKLPFTRQTYMKRTSALNEWAEADWSEVQGLPFIYSFFTVTARGLFLGFFEK